MSTFITRDLLKASLALTPTHSKHAWRKPQTRKTIGQPFEWIEPSRSRDDAISEAKRVAEEESIFGVGCAFCHLDKWYAADSRMGLVVDNISVTEIVVVEVGKK